MLALAKVLLGIAALAAVAGLTLLLIHRLTGGSGLPGDFVFAWGEGRVFLPVASCLLLSVVLSGLLYLLNLLRS